MESGLLRDVMSLPEPYLNEDGITLYCGDNRRIMPLLGNFDLLLTDPPYGIGADRIKYTSRLTASKDYGDTNWDQSPPEEWVMQLARARCAEQIIWGGNYFSLPPSKCWLVWDKVNGATEFADCELAWTNLPKAVRRIHHLWNGMFRKNNEPKFHPTQKPLDVMSWCFSHATNPKTVLDPWAGSGTTLVAARLRGIQAVGIELNEQYCETAKQRLAQGVLLVA